VQGITEAAKSQDRVTVAIFPPFVWLLGVLELLDGTGIELGGQDCYWEATGPFTGEVSAAMLAGFCQWVIVGHSERRAMGETDEAVARKAGAGLAAGLSTIICAGEHQEQHDAGQAAEVVAAQVTAALAECSADDSERLILAYEPVWAIGTGRNALGSDAAAMAEAIRSTLAGLGWGEAAGEVPVLYGGSVTAANIGEFLAEPSIDGALVGGASLKPDEMAGIVGRAGLTAAARLSAVS